MKKANRIFSISLLITFHILMFASCVENSQNNMRISRHDSIEIIPQEIHWGSLDRNNEYYDTIVHIKNPTKNEIKIDNVEVSCDCISVNLTDSIIPPKGQSQMKINLNISDISEYFERKIYIRYDSLKRVKIVYINGKV